MSLRLRDGPRGQNSRARRADSTRSIGTSIASDDSSAIFAKSHKLDGLLDSVLQKTAPSPTASVDQNKGSPDDDHMDTWTISDELKSQADESTAVSSVNNWAPVQTPSQIRATAPRALAGISEDKQQNLPSSSSSTQKLKDLPKDKPTVEDDGATLATLGTVDQNRPIDQVYIYSSTHSNGTPQFSPSPSLSSHRQRRQYRSGNRSTASSVASRRSRSSFAGSSRLGGILDTLGLGGESDMDSFTASTASSSKYKSMSRRLRGAPGDAQGQMGTYGRAGLVVFLLMTILYVQWNALGNQQDYVSKPGMRSHHYHRKYAPKDAEQGEGVDRPIYDQKLLDKMHHDPSDVALRNAKVEKKREGPEHVMDQIADRSAQGEGVNPPVDALPEREDAEDTDQVTIPSEIQIGYAGTYTKDRNHENLPLLWYIPRSGGGMIKNICSQCLGMTLASEVGGTIPSAGGTKQLELVSVGGHKYVNVDTTTEEGIEEAKSLGLASSGLAQLVVSPRFRESASIFDSKKGRAFALFRHPVERAVSMFYFLKKHEVPVVEKLTIEEYAKSPHVENNWMVRLLSGKMEGEVTENELAIAKEVLRTKIVVGLLERKEESMERFAHYFGWPLDEDGKQSACRTRILTGDYRTNESAKSQVKESSQAWSLIMWQNKLDMKLYKYAKALYLQQGAELFVEMPAK